MRKRERSFAAVPNERGAHKRRGRATRQHQRRSRGLDLILEESTIGTCEIGARSHSNRIRLADVADEVDAIEGELRCFRDEARGGVICTCAFDGVGLDDDVFEGNVGPRKVEATGKLTRQLVITNHRVVDRDGRLTRGVNRTGRGEDRIGFHERILYRNRRAAVDEYRRAIPDGGVGHEGAILDINFRAPVYGQATSSASGFRDDVATESRRFDGPCRAGHEEPAAVLLGIGAVGVKERVGDVERARGDRNTAAAIRCGVRGGMAEESGAR